MDFCYVVCDMIFCLAAFEVLHLLVWFEMEAIWVVVVDFVVSRFDWAR